MNYIKNMFLNISKSLFVVTTPLFIFDAFPENFMTDLTRITYLIISLGLGIYYLIKTFKQNGEKK